MYKERKRAWMKQNLNAYPQKKTKYNYYLIILLVCAIIFMLAKTYADPDLWGHLRFGLDQVETRKIIQVDQYSYNSAGQDWINHEWLAEVLFAIAWSAGNAPGLVILKTITGLLTIGIIYKYFISIQINYIVAALMVLLMGVSLFIVFYVSIRPQIFTFLFLTIELLIIRMAEKASYRWLWVMPVVILLWVNLHGGVIAGIGILCIWLPIHLFFNKNMWRKSIPPIVLSLAVLLINPYGIDLITFLLRTTLVPRSEISDWQPIILFSVAGFMYCLTLGLSIGGLIFSSKQRKPVPLVLFGVFVILPWMANRHLPLFSIAALILMGEHVASAWKKLIPDEIISTTDSFLRNGLYTLMSIILIFMTFSLNYWQVKIEKSVFDVPGTAVSLLKRSNVSGNLVTEFDWGQYIIWHLGPQIKVSIDGRRETVYTETAYKQAISFMFGTGEWDAILEQYNTDIALVKMNSSAYNLLKLSPGWIIVFEDSKSVLFLNEKSPIADTLKRTAAEFNPPEMLGYFP